MTPTAAPQLTVTSLTAHPERAAELLTAAADRTPLAAWLVDDLAHRDRILTGHYTLLIEQALASGHVDLAVDETGTWVGLAVWLDRTRPAPTPTLERLAPLAGSHLPRFQARQQALDQRRPPAPHHFLAELCGPGHAVTAALIACGHRRADADGVFAYTVAAGPEDRDRLTQYCYQPTAPIPLPAGGPTLQPLLRPLWADRHCTKGKPWTT